MTRGMGDLAVHSRDVRWRKLAFQLAPVLISCSKVESYFCRCFYGRCETGQLVLLFASSMTRNTFNFIVQLWECSCWECKAIFFTHFAYICISYFEHVNLYNDLNV